jgi:hypothetical protein
VSLNKEPINDLYRMDKGSPRWRSEKTLNSTLVAVGGLIMEPLPMVKVVVRCALEPCHDRESCSDLTLAKVRSPGVPTGLGGLRPIRHIVYAAILRVARQVDGSDV